MQRRLVRIANTAGILATDTWRYYVDNFQCSHFVGTGTEDNYYLLKPFYLRSSQIVNSRRRFWEFYSEHLEDLGLTTEGVDFVISDHQAAVRIARILIHPELVDLDEFEKQLRYIDSRRQHFHPGFFPIRVYSRYLALISQRDFQDNPEVAQAFFHNQLLLWQNAEEDI